MAQIHWQRWCRNMLPKSDFFRDDYLGAQNAGVNLNALAPVSVPRRLAAGIVPAGPGRDCATQSHPNRLRSANSRTASSQRRG